MPLRTAEYPTNHLQSRSNLRNENIPRVAVAERSCPHVRKPFPIAPHVDEMSKQKGVSMITLPRTKAHGMQAKTFPASLELKQRGMEAAHLFC